MMTRTPLEHVNNKPYIKQPPNGQIHECVTHKGNTSHSIEAKCVICQTSHLETKNLSSEKHCLTLKSTGSDPVYANVIKVYAYGVEKLH